MNKHEVLLMVRYSSAPVLVIMKAQGRVGSSAVLGDSYCVLNSDIGSE